MAIIRKPAVLSGQGRLYLDHAATTPMLAEAREAVAAAMENWANASSPHADGRQARATLEEARRTIAQELGWRHDVIFTSGASEAVQIAAARVKAGRRIVGSTEHDVVISAMGERATNLPVDRNGLIELDALKAALAGPPALVAIQLANNETGVIQPIEQIREMVADAGSLLFVDCAQAAGKISLPKADLIAVSAHKFGGPPGVGALLVKDLSTLEPSGGQERGYRRGTENWPAVVGMAAALGTRAFAAAMPQLALMRRSLEREIVEAGGIVVAAETPRIATIDAYAMAGISNTTQLVELDLAGISVSAGSACSSGSLKSSRVLAAMGVSEEISRCTIRVSFGPTTSEFDVERFLGEWRRIRNRAKARAA